MEGPYLAKNAKDGHPDTDCAGADGQEVTSGFSLRVRVPGAGTWPNGMEVYSLVKERGMLAARAATVLLYHCFKHTITLLLIFVQKNQPLRHAPLPPGKQAGIFGQDCTC